MNRNQILYIQGKDIFSSTLSLLEKAGLKEIISDTNARICLKPNLVVAAKSSGGAVTHPEITDAVISYLKSNNFNNISLMEGSWLGDDTDRAFKVSGIAEVCRKHYVPFYNTKKDRYTKIESQGHSFFVTQRLNDVDWLINMPVLKGHCQTLMTCALKNHKGLLSDSEKRRFHAEGLHTPIAWLAKAVTEKVNEFIVVDNICGDPSFEEGGNPSYTGRILCSLDPVLCDCYACSFFGYDTTDVKYVEIARQIFGTSQYKNPFELIDISTMTQNKDAVTGIPDRKAQMLGEYTEADNACSACYAMLISALSRIESEGKLQNLHCKIKTGQGFRGRTAEGAGSGNCTCGCSEYVKGCPPDADSIYNFIKKRLQSNANK